jgi:23S rRNA pseudouridine1911/1915/1917 synthase
MQSLQIDETMEDERLDVVVSKIFPDLSRSSIQKLSKMGKVSLNNKLSKPSHKVHSGDIVKVDYDREEGLKVIEITLPVIYEDDDVIVINKPRGLLTHSKGVFNPEPTVATWLSNQVTDLSGERAGIAHRLDRATSGVMIVAKNAKALGWLQKQFSNRRVRKTYTAVISGEIDPLEATVDMPIQRNPKAPATFKVGANGKPSITRYKTIKIGPSHSLIELKPETGRTHQLRVHLEKLKHPIVGDTLYGGELSDRLYLHAQSLELTLPSRERKKFTVSVPASFDTLVEKE